MKFSKILLSALTALLLAVGSLPAQAQTTSVPEKLIITVDCGHTFQEMIAAGRYDWWDSNITKDRFPVNCIGKVKHDVELIHYGYAISSEDVVKNLAERNFRPATIEELLAFGTKYPDFQRQFPIVALGSFARVSGLLNVPHIGRNDAERYLNLSSPYLDWPSRYRFLGIRLHAQEGNK